MNNDIELIKMVGQIAGIGGLSLGVLLIIFKDIIKKNIFPKFKNEYLSFNLLKLIIILTWSLAISGILALVFIETKNHDISTKNNNGRKSWENIEIKRESIMKEANNQFHNIGYPQIFGLTNIKLEPKINSLLKRTAINIHDSYYDWTEVHIDYKIRFRKYNLLGLVFEIMIFNEGAAHSLFKAVPFSINLETGEPFEFKDLFKTGYKPIINDLVIKELKKNGMYIPCKKKSDAEINPVEFALKLILGTDSPACFSTVKDDISFFITDTSVVLVFPQYSVTTGVHGNVEIALRFENIERVINPNGPLKIFF